MKILSIGNSFSQDAQRYLHQIAKNQGVNLTCVNLYIGGCSLQTHYNNSINNQPLYDYEVNGKFEGRKISLNDALLSDNWDLVTLQQASNFSYIYNTYIPYAEELKRFVLERVKNAKIFIHQTWAYEEGSERLTKIGGFSTALDMYEAVCDSYQKAAQSICADGIIPCGAAMMQASKMGIEKIHRDTFHASLGAGRYLLALCWYKKLLGKDISHDDFNEFDVPVTEEERKIVIKAVNAVC